MMQKDVTVQRVPLAADNLRMNDVIYVRSVIYVSGMSSMRGNVINVQ
jgi:hypothetical protein